LGFITISLKSMTELAYVCNSTVKNTPKTKRNNVMFRCPLWK